MANFKYRQLAELLKNDIINSVFSVGEQVPTEDVLIERFGVSRNTVRQAVKSLVEQGYLHKIQGSGTFVSEGSTGKAKQYNNGNSKRIGVVLSHNNTYIFPRVLMGISDYLSEHGYSMMFRITFNRIASEEETLRELADSDLAGLIIEPARSGLPVVNGDMYRKIQETMPCVFIHAKFPEFDIPSITLDDIGGVELLVDHLVEKGHKNIAAFLKFDEYPGTERFQGYVAGLRKHGIPLDEGRILWFADEDDLGDLFSEANTHRIKNVIGNSTAVICYNDGIVPAVYSYLERQGISVPDDLSIVGYDNSKENKTALPTTIDHPKEHLGRAAAEAILTLIKNPEADVSRRFEAKLIDRGSVREV